MIRGMTLLWTVLAMVVGIALFTLKHEVQSLEERLAKVNREIYANQEAIHVLKAEWTYLNDPTRLKSLSERLLSMKAVKPEQIASLSAEAQPAPAAAPAPRPAAPQGNERAAPPAKGEARHQLAGNLVSGTAASTSSVSGNHPTAIQIAQPARAESLPVAALQALTNALGLRTPSLIENELRSNR